MRITQQQQRGFAEAFSITFTATRQIMQERAERLGWQEMQPQVQAKLQALGKPMAEAEKALKAAKTPEAMAAAGEAKAVAFRDFSMETMKLSAELRASGNANAQRYGQQLQQGLVQAIGMEQGQQRIELEKHAQKQQLELEDLRNKHQMQQEKLHSDERIEDKRLDAARYKESIGARTKQEEIEGKVRERNDVLRGIQIETEKLQQENIRAGKKLDPRKEMILDMEARDFIDQAVENKQMSPEEGDQKRKALNLPEKYKDPGYAGRGFETKLKDAEEMERNATPAQRPRARALLDAAREENKAEMVKQNEFKLLSSELESRGKTWMDFFNEEQPGEYQKMIRKLMEEAAPNSRGQLGQ
jgi:hypothetical protein